MKRDALTGRKVVITGVTGQVARPLAVSLARHNEVYGAARFTDAAARAALESAVVHCVAVDLAQGDVAGRPPDADLVLHFAVAKTNDWEVDLASNSGGLASLMEHHQRAQAFLHCSTTGVYKPEGHRQFAEDGPLGDNHGVWSFLRTYSICKTSEGTARWAASRFGLPTTFARLSVPYGDNGGWPAIHQDDIVAMVPGLLAVASVPAATVNWGGSEAVSIEEWCTCPWRDGMKRMARALHPDKVH